MPFLTFFLFMSFLPVKFNDAIMLLGSVEKYAFDHNWIASELVFWLCHFCLIESSYDYYINLFTILWFGNSRSIRHPASGYVQGINDLVTPFLVVFLSEHLEGNIDTWSTDDLSPQDISNIEADCYWCLSKFLDVMQDHYTFAQPGIQRLVFRLKELVRRIDGNVLLILMHCQFWFWFLPIFSPLINCHI